MRHLLVLAVLCVVGVAAYSADSVEQIIALAQKNVGEDALMAAVDANKAGFNVSAQDIIKLKENNVPDKVITAMLQRRPAGNAVAAMPAPARAEAPAAPPPAAAANGVLNIENLDDRTWSYRYEPETKTIWISSAAADGRGNIAAHDGLSLRMPTGNFEVRYNGQNSGFPVAVRAGEKSLLMVSRVDTAELEALYVSIFENGERRTAGKLVTFREGKSKRRSENDQPLNEQPVKEVVTERVVEAPNTTVIYRERPVLVAPYVYPSCPPRYYGPYHRHSGWSLGIGVGF